MIDPTVTIGNIIEILTIAVGGIVVFSSLRVSVVDLKQDVSDMKEDIKILNRVIVQMAVADERDIATQKHMNELESDIRELRHGRGFVREAIQGEWPKT